MDSGRDVTTVVVEIDDGQAEDIPPRALRFVQTGRYRVLSDLRAFRDLESLRPGLTEVSTEI